MWGGMMIEKLNNHLDINRMYEKSKKLIEGDMISMDDFKGFYDKQVLRKDKNYVREREKNFKERTGDEKMIDKLAIMLEGIFYEQVELSDWMGPNTFTIKTSRFDDIYNGVDCVLEFQEPDSPYLALAVDLTISDDLSGKFKRIKEEIKKGYLARVKYFISDRAEISKDQPSAFLGKNSCYCSPYQYRGELLNIPRIIIGISRKTVMDLGFLWIENKKKKLAHHWVQFQILDEIIIQLGQFKRFAQKANQGKLVRVYSQIEKVVSKIIDDKNSYLSDPGERDNIFESIKDGINILEKARMS